MLLRLLRESGPMTGTELIELSGLTRATVIAICEDLMDRGWVRELENQRAAGDYVKGRPARRFAFSERAAFVLGIDIGNWKVTAVVADMAGTILSKVAKRFRTINVPAGERAGVLDQTVKEALEQAGVPPERVLAVSAGVSAPVSRDGEILTAQEFWKSFDVRKAVFARHGSHVLIENDANLAALAERWRGTAQGVDDLAVVLAGDRLGAGVLESGRLLHGSSGAFGELGYLFQLEGVGDPMGIAYCAQLWGQEALMSGAATRLRELCGGDPEQLAAEAVFTAAAEGDRTAVEILDRIAERMARVIGSMSTLVNPELVVIAGAVAASADAIIPAIEKHLPEFTATPPRVRASTLGDGIVSIGAVRHALDYVEEHALELRPNSLADRSPARVPG